MDEWSNEELAASVTAYRNMQKLQAQRKPYSKVAQYRELAAKFPQRTPKAFEYRMQNISAVLHEQGNPWILGLKPAGNVGANMRPRIEALLASTHPGRKVAGYKLMLPAMRAWLIRVARRGKSVTYGEVIEAFGISRFNLSFALSQLAIESQQRGEPILAAMVVGRRTGRCGSNIISGFRIDDQAERERLHVFWQAHDVEIPTLSSTATTEERIARFVSVEVRPGQAAFRRRVVEAFGLQCVISGCSVGEALDAAHKTGRDWRKGHNSAGDGYILRKDLHALYDAELLKITEDGIVTVDFSIAQQYGTFSGAKVPI